MWLIEITDRSNIFFPLKNVCELTGLVCGVIILDQEGITVVPDLLAGLRVIVGDQRLQLRIKDALSHDNVDGRLTIASGYRKGSLPHGMHWKTGEARREQEKEDGI